MMVRFRNVLQKMQPLWFGVGARYVIYFYIRSTLMMMFILLMIAITIDLATHLPSIRARAEETGTAYPVYLAPYLLYRATDIVTHLWGIACFFGVFLAEIFRSRRLEKPLFSLAGVSPFNALAPVLVFGLLAGVAQMSLENWARPAAVFAQVDLGFGAYGRRFKAGLKDSPSWFLRETEALRARVSIGENPELWAIELFQGIDQERLTSIILAERAVPTDTPEVWQFINVVKWDAIPGQKDYAPSAIDRLDIDIGLIATQVRYHGIQGFYLPWPALREIAQMKDAPTIDGANVAIWRRWTAIFLPGAFALLAASLAHIGCPGREQRIVPLVAFALIGYLMIVSVKVFWSLGEKGFLSAPATVFIAMGTAVVISLLLQIRSSFR